MTPTIELVVRYGAYGEKLARAMLPIDEMLMRELMEGVERSDDSFSLLLASPGLMGGYGDAVTIRRRKFEMRRDFAESIARSMVPALLKAFGVNDVTDGYTQDELKRMGKTNDR